MLVWIVYLIGLRCLLVCLTLFGNAGWWFAGLISTWMFYFWFAGILFTLFIWFCVFVSLVVDALLEYFDFAVCFCDCLGV